MIQVPKWLPVEPGGRRQEPGQGSAPQPEPLGKINKKYLDEWLAESQEELWIREISTRRVQQQTMREFNLRFRHMDGVQKVRAPGMPRWLPERAKPWEEEGLENPMGQPFLGPLPKAEKLGTAEKQYLDEWRAQGKNPAYGTREIKK